MSVWSHCLPLLGGCTVTLAAIGQTCTYFEGPPPTNNFGPGITLDNLCGEVSGTITYYLEMSSCDNPDPFAGPWDLIATAGPSALTVPAGLGFLTGHLFEAILQVPSYCAVRTRMEATLGGVAYTWIYSDFICGTS